MIRLKMKFKIYKTKKCGFQFYWLICGNINIYWTQFWNLVMDFKINTLIWCLLNKDSISWQVLSKCKHQVYNILMSGRVKPQKIILTNVNRKYWYLMCRDNWCQMNRQFWLLIQWSNRGEKCVCPVGKQSYSSEQV